MLTRHSQTRSKSAERERTGHGRVRKLAAKTVSEPLPFESDLNKPLAAQKVLCLTTRRFTASQRALWHLAHCRRVVSVVEQGSWDADTNGAQVVHVEPSEAPMRGFAAKRLGQLQLGKLGPRGGR